VRTFDEWRRMIIINKKMLLIKKRIFFLQLLRNRRKIKQLREGFYQIVGNGDARIYKTFFDKWRKLTSNVIVRRERLAEIGNNRRIGELQHSFYSWKLQAKYNKLKNVIIPRNAMRRVFNALAENREEKSKYRLNLLIACRFREEKAIHRIFLALKENLVSEKRAQEYYLLVQKKKQRRIFLQFHNCTNLLKSYRLKLTIILQSRAKRAFNSWLNLAFALAFRRHILLKCWTPWFTSKCNKLMAKTNQLNAHLQLKQEIRLKDCFDTLKINSDEAKNRRLILDKGARFRVQKIKQKCFAGFKEVHLRDYHDKENWISKKLRLRTEWNIFKAWYKLAASNIRETTNEQKALIFWSDRLKSFCFKSIRLHSIRKIRKYKLERFAVTSFLARERKAFLESLLCLGKKEELNQKNLNPEPMYEKPLQTSFPEKIIIPKPAPIKKNPSRLQPYTSLSPIIKEETVPESRHVPRGFSTWADYVNALLLQYRSASLELPPKSPYIVSLKAEIASAYKILKKRT